MSEDKNEEIIAEIPAEDFQDDKEALELIRSLAGKTNPEVKKEQEQETKKDFKIPKDKTFDKDPTDAQVNKSLLDENIITEKDITQIEKDAFLKSILHDVPVVLESSLFNDNVHIELKARTVYEQQVISSILNEDIKPANFTEYVERTQELCAALMLTKFNNKIYTPPKINKDVGSIEECKKIVTEYVQTIIYDLSTFKWQVIVKAISQFELKCQLMINLCNDRNFWNPRDPD